MKIITIDREFGGMSSSALMVVLHSGDETTDAAPYRDAVKEVSSVLGANEDVGAIVTPYDPGGWVSEDGHTAVVQGAALDVHYHERLAGLAQGREQLLLSAQQRERGAVISLATIHIAY